MKVILNIIAFLACFIPNMMLAEQGIVFLTAPIAGAIFGGVITGFSMTKDGLKMIAMSAILSTVFFGAIHLWA